MIDHKLIKQSENVLNQRYSNRLKKFGNDPRTLGWDNKSNQRARFKIAAESLNMKNFSILDVGCGLADFHDYLQDENINVSSYSGIDINSELIDACREKNPGAKEFIVGNLLTRTIPPESYDIVTMFGLLNFKFKEFQNASFAEEMIYKGFKLARHALVIDMLSNKTDSQYPLEDFVYYYEPSKILDLALSLTPHVHMRHDYASIPQREFLMVLRKEPWK